RDETATHRQPGVGGKNHVGQPRLRRDQLDLALEAGEFVEEPFPLRLHHRCIGAASAAHPWIDLVFDPVMVRRTKEKLAHKRKRVTARGSSLTHAGTAPGP